MSSSTPKTQQRYQPPAEDDDFTQNEDNFFVLDSEKQPVNEGKEKEMPPLDREGTNKTRTREQA
jgi:hypothetical protein